MKPEILISFGKEPVPNYPAAVEAFGGTPSGAYLPAPEPERYDALLLSGGGDVAPARYGEENTACFRVDEARDEAEFRLIDAFLRAGKPILGICRGHQVLNVYFGGSLVQHLPGAEKHTPTPAGDGVHRTHALAGSFPAELYGAEFPVNSAPHQGIGRLAPELEAVQWAEDGVIEACRHRSLPVWSVQWHPERMCLRHARPDAVDGGVLFRWFLEQAAKK